MIRPALLAAAMLASLPVAADEIPLPRLRPTEITISNNLGGNPFERAEQVRSLITAGIRVRLEGSCLSSCTMLLRLLATDQLCAEPNTFLMFHRPFMRPHEAQAAIDQAVATGQNEADIRRQMDVALDNANRLMMAHYWPSLAEYLAPMWPQTSPQVFIVLMAVEELRVPECEPGPTS